MIDLKLERLDHDLVFAAGDLVLVDGGDQTTQHIKQRLLTILGEWFLDQSIGLPWFDEILGKYRTLDVVEALLRNCITGTPNVARLTRFALTVDETRERTVRVDFSVLLVGSEIAQNVYLEI